MLLHHSYEYSEFQSTPSARRATAPTRIPASTPTYFNPRPPRGERPTQHRHGARCRVFQSTPSARRATQYVWAKNKEGKISIHALREESDVLLFQQILLQGYFNPRPPRGGRHRQSCRVCITTLFQSTPSARRATNEAHFNQVPNLISIHALREEGDSGRKNELQGVRISIHALREEGDITSTAGSLTTSDFNPRPPRGGRPASFST